MSLVHVTSTHRTSRPFTGGGVTMHQVVAGRGRVEVGGRVHALCGDGTLILNPGQAHRVVAGNSRVLSIELSPEICSGERFAEALTPRDFGIDRATSRLLTASMIGDRQAADEGALQILDAMRFARDESSQNYFLAETGRTTGKSQFMAQARSLILCRLPRQMNLEQLSLALAYSEFHFHRSFRAWHGMTVGQYIQAERVRRACRRLILEDSPVADVAHSCGFLSSTSFVRTFKKITGHTPSEFRALRAHHRSDLGFFVRALQSCASGQASA